MQQAILATLIYGNIFDWPMTEDEIWQWLIAENGKWKMEGGRFKKGLRKLVKEKKCGTKNGLYFLPGREKLVAIREKRSQWSDEKITKAQKITRILKLIPWIKLIGVTGAVACSNAQKEDDIDLFLITAQERLWLTRGLVVLILRFLGVYRRPDKISDMFCPNMFLDETSLQISKNKQNLFSAHEIYQMKPLVVKDGILGKFLGANLWAKRFLPNAEQWTIDNLPRSPRVEAGQQAGGQWGNKKIINYQILNINYFECLARKIQLWYMRKSRTTETITDKTIRFHPHDVSQEILAKYIKQTKDLKILNS